MGALSLDYSMTLNDYSIHIHKLAQLLNGETMFFDHFSYEYAEDIPHLMINNQRENVSSVFIKRNGSYMNVAAEYGQIQIDFMTANISQIELDELFRDIYYNHPLSWIIGDYENDFLMSSF